MHVLSYISGNNYHFTSARRAGREPVHSHQVHLLYRLLKPCTDQFYIFFCIIEGLFQEPCNLF